MRRKIGKLSTRALLDDSWESIEESLPYCNLVQFSESLYQISLAACKAIWSEDPNQTKNLHAYFQEKINFLKSVKPSRQTEEIARDMLLGDFQVLYAIFQKASVQYDGKANNPGKNPSTESLISFEDIEHKIVAMILARDTTKVSRRFQEKIANMTSDAYRDQETEKFRRLCSYTSALVYFKRAISQLM